MLFETEIKTALKAAGLNEGLCDQIKVETVDEIEGAIKQLKSDKDKVKSLTESEFLETVKKAGLEDALKNYATREFDRRVTDAVQKHDEKLKRAAADAEAGKKKEKDQEALTPEQKVIQSLQDKIKTQGEEIKSISAKLSSSDMGSSIRAELIKAGLSEAFETDIKVDDPGKIAEAVSGLKVKVDAHQQATINKKLEAGELSSVGKGAASATLEASQIADFAKSRGKDGLVKNPDFQGKISSPETVASTASEK